MYHLSTRQSGCFTPVAQPPVATSSRPRTSRPASYAHPVRPSWGHKINQAQNSVRLVHPPAPLSAPVPLHMDPTISYDSFGYPTMVPDAASPTARTAPPPYSDAQPATKRPYLRHNHTRSLDEVPAAHLYALHAHYLAELSSKSPQYHRQEHKIPSPSDNAWPRIPELVVESQTEDFQDGSVGPASPSIILSGSQRSPQRIRFATPIAIVAPEPVVQVDVKQENKPEDMPAKINQKISGSQILLGTAAESKATIEHIKYKHYKAVSRFRIPKDIKFDSTSISSMPKLLDSTHNKPILEHRQKLQILRDLLASVKTHKNAEVRNLRNEVIYEVEESLEELNRLQKMAWYLQRHEQKHKPKTKSADCPVA